MGWLILIGYVAGWLVTSVATARWLASRARCVDRALPSRGHAIFCYTYGPNLTRIYCERPAEQRIYDAPLGMAAALLWPLILPAVLIHRAATPPPTADQAYIARLERELGIEAER